MELLNVFSILKYGAKIFLAVMGFISFDDINVKPVGNIDTNIAAIQKVNYVESIQTDSENISYADASYFISENDNNDKLFTSQNDYISEEEAICLDEQLENNTKVFENIFLLETENIEDLEILVLNENEKLNFECLIKVIDGKHITQTMAKSLKSVQVIHLNSTY